MRYEGENLILLFGLPRSGTTWVAKMFDSHPDVVYRHEPEAVDRIEGVPPFIKEKDYSRYETALREYAQGLVRMSNPRVMGKRPFLPKSYLGPVRFRLHTASILLSTVAAQISLRLPVYNPAKRLPPERIRVVWKSVSGIGRLPALLHALPKARAVLIMRHPAGFVASQIRGLKSRVFGDAPPLTGKTGTLRQRIRDEVQRRYGLTDQDIANLTVEERFTWRWVIDHDQALERLASVQRCTPVWYEDLCLDPVTGYRHLFELTGLTWGPHTERFLSATTDQHDDGYYSVYKNPVEVAYRWQNELSPDAIRSICAILKLTSVAAPRLLPLDATDTRESQSASNPVQ
ncbi:hypothetical protein B1C78_15545 [Thioalkalivibrio denitrificans]|uniref:Sulfotransferase family protein n=1 Tax=Thioalkalivibrio denitrificans TaxID=108003 RepID=A0A1V3NAG7_9GAMM|nr:sulfotransferase [Thioalkalivibrio denitrificans]OOG22024.1 hypothetical protein B1C78_15545 [Thioalkalivibrio denitrificans]